ncbi:MAG TPA: hydrogenase 4 subunit B [Acetobacteraceae bacterium]|nr:hydrogenase 4 subunit B [Acetobacteraceae bacterium]
MILVLLAGTAVLLALALAGAVVKGQGRSLYAIASFVAFLSAILALVSLPARPETLVLPLGLPWLGWHFRLDPLSAFFLLVVDLGAASSSLFAIGYGRHEAEPGRVLPFFPLFLAALQLVVLAADAFSFLFSWELMSLASWALVLVQHRDRESIRAGYVYLVMALLSGLALLLCFGLLAGASGSYAFSAMRLAHPAPGLAVLALLLALIGTGAKAGLVPLHAWLPLAHPAAPSQVSALMSGVMTKVAVYAFLRIAFTLLPIPPAWAGLLVTALGGITAVLGVLYALMQHDLKRLLAYHTVENIGIIFIGIGLAMVFRAAGGEEAAAALALTAALFHVLNHSLFKSLLFFGAGAVDRATGTRDMERGGGLIHRMPQTAFFFLIGCAAISALPPLNGFVSEWLTFQAILLGPGLPAWGPKIIIPVAGALLALAASLAAACFVKAFGITFLGRPRSREAAEAAETDRFSLSAMGILAVLCFLAGIFPAAVINAFAPVSRALLGAAMPGQSHLPWGTIIPVAAARSSYDGSAIFLLILAVTVLAVAGARRLAAHAVRRAPAWDCGFPDPRPVTQYTATSFAEPIRRVFGPIIFGAASIVRMPPPGATAPAEIETALHDRLWEIFYDPVAAAVARLADAANHLQFLTIRRYLFFVFAALVMLLFALALQR